MPEGCGEPVEGSTHGGESHALCLQFVIRGRAVHREDLDRLERLIAGELPIEIGRATIAIEEIDHKLFIAELNKLNRITDWSGESEQILQPWLKSPCVVAHRIVPFLDRMKAIARQASSRRIARSLGAGDSEENHARRQQAWLGNSPANRFQGRGA
ncbi:hypothetical protein SAMN05216548_10426 [Faunimonas pinastri]|uniref:Uncharacterized protein n=2 Tax=Faunimonas pinastri TaxID=1855383 RepID=A0A1H9F8X3_9HYPH|nr:hypothetical protein SAMN05216548_10426 [Faunimonas pinastri]